MLCQISAQAGLFLDRMVRGVQTLGLDANERKNCLDAAGSVLKRSTSISNLCTLDHALESLQHEIPEINLMVGVLTITNDESYSLLYQSARYLDVSSYSHTEFDLRAGTIKVPSAFGVIPTFEVDLHIFPQGRTRNREDVTVKQSVILISALRACVRSHMLACTLALGLL